MIKAVLLDMDNTLLRNPDMAFAQAFLSIFGDYFHAHGYTDIIPNLRKAIRVMGSGQRGNRTNRQVLVDLAGGDPEEMNQLIDSFYADIYPQLQNCISAVPGAKELIYQLREMDYSVVIATNPLYPESAIRQRMSWAGLPLEDDLYALITSADTMHFAKPDPAYYGEILGRVGVEPDEAIMIGDSLRNDISPAQTVGLHTFHTGEEGLQAFIDDLPAQLNKAFAPILCSAMIEPQFRGNIGALHGFVDTVQDHFWHQRPDPGEWSIVQILCHLVTSEDENERPRLQRILQEENPFITQAQQPGPDIETCADTGHPVVKNFMETREKTIEMIASFTGDDWSRPARHSIFGLTTMLEMAYFTAQHDRLHLKQLCQTIGRCE